MITNVDKPPVASILANDINKIYRVPRYQREYIWGQWNWSALYDDVYESDPGYFLGSIIVIQGPINPTTGYFEYEVIDGQQRLTTISLLLATLYAALEARKDVLDTEEYYEKVFPIRHRLIYKVDKTTTRVIPQVQNDNLNDYRWAMHEYAGLQGVYEKPKFYGLRRISRACQYFTKRINDELAGLDDPAAVNKLLLMVKKLLDAVIVQIDVDSHADAYTLFASLNNRGVPLSAVDLIKNTLLAKLSDADDSELDHYFDQWQVVLRRLGDDPVTQERFFRQNYDAFRREINEPYATPGAQLPLGSVATRTNLLTIYEKRIASENPGPRGVLKELLANSEIYSKILCTDDVDDGILDVRLTELARAQGVPSYLLLLYMLKYRDKLELTDSNVADTVAMLTRFFVQRNVTDTPPTRDLERLFISICEEIEDTGVKGTGIVGLIHKRLLAVSASDDSFRNSLMGPMYDTNPDATRFILAALAEPSVTKEMRGLWDRYPSGNYVWTIEHIFPQGQNIPEEWVEMIGGGDADKAREIQDEYVHTLGNLTITGYNSKLSNLPFVEKRDRQDRSGAYVGYRNGLNLNADLVDCDEWNKEKIIKRRDKLVAEALKVFAL